MNYYILKEYEQNLMYIEDVLKTSSTTNNIQLEKLCKNLFDDLFIGVFTADKYPKHILNGEMFITNNRKNRGEHWVAVSKYNNKMYAYDTFNRNIHKASIFWKNNIIGYLQIKIEIKVIMNMIVVKGVYVG